MFSSLHAWIWFCPSMARHGYSCFVMLLSLLLWCSEVCCNKNLRQVMAVRPRCQGRNGLQSTLPSHERLKSNRSERLIVFMNLSESLILNFRGSCHVASPFPQSPLFMSSTLGRPHGLDSNSTPGIGVHPFSWTNRRPALVSTWKVCDCYQCDQEQVLKMHRDTLYTH